MLVILFLGLMCCSYVRADCTPDSDSDWDWYEPGCQFQADNGTIFGILSNDKDLCEDFTEHCCWYKNECFDKKHEETGPLIPMGLFEVPTKKKRRAKLSRFLGLRPPNPCLPPPFPTNCNPDEHSKYVTEPPMNIPYCVRIPCSEDKADQKEYDNDWKACGSQPGCYFDNELYEFRRDGNRNYLPGVPVCHLAIRAPAFHVHAQAVIDYWGVWNPYFTECTLNTYEKEIYAGQPGCKLISLLKIFGCLPKMAGWDGIIEWHCWLIGGCWRHGEGCFYPVNVIDLVVKSGQRFKFNRYEIVFGRPKCQNFDPRTHYSILRSYHNCLKAGCSVDANVAFAYYNHLFAIGNSMSVENHWDFWDAVEAGKIGSHNLEGIIWPYKDVPAIDEPTRPPPPPPPRGQGGNNPFALPGGFGGGRGSGGRSPAPPPLQSGESKGCGHAFRRLGYRPCPPQYLPDIHADLECPYVPQRFPRFEPLKGSFKGCCEINACYLSRADIRAMHSGPSYYYTPWGPYTVCSKKCGGGIKKRFRQCVSNDESKCTEPEEETVECNTHPCERYGLWTKWTPCASRCGIQTRRRYCSKQGRGEICDGDGEETRRCSVFC